MQVTKKFLTNGHLLEKNILYENMYDKWVSSCHENQMLMEVNRILKEKNISLSKQLDCVTTECKELKEKAFEAHDKYLVAWNLYSDATVKLKKWSASGVKLDKILS